VTQYITTQEVAARLSCSEKTVLRLARRGVIPYVRFGHGYRFDLDEIVVACSRRGEDIDAHQRLSPPDET